MRDLVKNGVNSVYRFVLAKLVSPEMYARMIPRLWHQLHTTGERKLEIVFEAMDCKNVRWQRVRCITRDGGDECVSTVKWRSR